MNNARITVRFDMIGFHRWPGATGVRSYLAYEHRHTFNFTVSCEVTHDDREIEFHNLIDIAKVFANDIGDCNGMFGAMSCEAIARALGDKLVKMYSRPFIVSVEEDHECGATVECGR